MSASSAVTLHSRGRIGVAVIDNPPVNALSQPVRAGLVEVVERFRGDDGLDALVLLCAGKSFSAGADIKEFGKPLIDPPLGVALAAIEGADKPVVAAIHGKALGGGLELALACHYRVATTDSRIGLPEVKLGILPGAGGTQRLPRLIGLEAALGMITEGNEITAAKAQQLGAIDAVIEGDLESGAVAFAERIVTEGRGVRRTGELPPPPENASLFEETARSLAKKKRGFEAPQRALEAVRFAYQYPFDEALRREHALCKELLVSPQSRALRHLFAAEREVAKIPGLPADTPTRSVNKVAVVGMGLMGTGIAMAFANAGIPVVALHRSQDKLDRAMANIARQYNGQAAKGSLSQEEAEQRIGLIRPVLNYDGLTDADLIIEAVAEDLAVKREVFAILGRVAKPEAILATNTSYLDIDTLAEASGRPADVCGMHFLNPAHIMRLLENVRGPRTAPDVLATIMAVGRRIGKLPILAGAAEGFIINRMLAKRSREAAFMLEEGATPAQVDKVLLGYGFPMGPYALADLAGIDLQYAARQARFDRLSEREKQANFVDQLYRMGRYGQKTGAGWYRYDENRKSSPDPVIDELLLEHSKKRGLTRRVVEDDEILERCLYAMVNEGAKIIEEGIASRPHEIDVAMVNGIGFPAYTGGPLWWADQIGLGKVRDAMYRYRDIAGSEFWTPAPLLERLASEGKGFYST